MVPLKPFGKKVGTGLHTFSLPMEFRLVVGKGIDFNTFRVGKFTQSSKHYNSGDSL